MAIEPWVPVFYEAPGIGPAEYIAIAVGFGAALLGAIVGGWMSGRQARAQRDDQDRREALNTAATEKGRLIVAQFQASLILSDVESTIDAIERSLKIAEDRGHPDQPLFLRMFPIIGHMKTPTLDIEAIAPLIRARENDIVKSYLEAHAKHQVLSDSLARFDLIKQDLNDRVSPFMTFHNGVPAVEMTADRQAKLQPFFDSADSLAKQIISSANELREIARAATFGIGPIASRLYDDPNFPTLRPEQVASRNG